MNLLAGMRESIRDLFLGLDEFHDCGTKGQRQLDFDITGSVGAGLIHITDDHRFSFINGQGARQIDIKRNDSDT